MAICLVGGLTLSSPSIAGPRVADLLREARAYLKVGVKASGDATVTGPGAADLLTFAGADEGSARVRWSVARDKHLQLGAATVEHKQLKLRRTPPEARLLALVLATTDLERAAKRLEIRLPRELMTLDRIGGAWVWAIGDATMAVWLDRELLRPVRILIASGVLDDHQWVARLRYADEGPFKGWVPVSVELLRDDVMHLQVSLTPAGSSAPNPLP